MIQVRRAVVAAALALVLGVAACGQPAPPPATLASPAAHTPQAAHQAPAPSVADLRGARASSGESEMQTRGFAVARQRGLTAYWLHAPSGSCVRTVTSGGRYTTVDSVPASNCGR